MILFTIALPIEAKTIKQEIKNLNLKWIKIDFLITWVWVLNTIYSIKDYIEKNAKPDFIVNIWVCWKTESESEDFFQVYRIKNLSNNKEVICPVYIDFLELHSIACSDKIITDKSELIDIQEKFQNEKVWGKKTFSKWVYENINEQEISFFDKKISKFSDFSFVDMESFWIDFIADKEKIPYIIIKKPFDLISKDSLNVSKNELENCLIWFDYKKLLNEIEKFILYLENKNDFEEDIKYLKELFKLTFSQTEILKKYFYKQKALNKNIIDLKILEKKDFLKEITD